MGPPPMDKRAMSAVDYSDYQRTVRWMEDAEAQSRGVTVRMVRPIVAREIGVPPGTLEDIRKGRLKSLRGHVERAIDAALVKFLEAQKKAIEHELGVAVARVGSGRGGVVQKAEAARDALDTLIVEARA